MVLTSSLEDIIKEELKVRKNTHVMLVDGISKLRTHKVITCQTSVFHISGLKWKLIVYPAGFNGSKDTLFMFVRVKDKKSLPSNWEVTCSLKLFLIDQEGAQMYYSTTPGTSMYFGATSPRPKGDFMTSLSPYLVNDKVCCCAEISNVRTNFTVTNLPRTIGTSERLKLSEIPRNKSRFTWKITQFSSFDGDCHSSYEFTAGPRRWKILMYPKGNEEGKGNSLSLYLEVTDYLRNVPKAKTLAVYKLRILDQFHRNHYETTFIKWFPHDPAAPLHLRTEGSAKYLSLEELRNSSRGFLVNDQIYIGVEFLLLSTTEDL